MSNPHHHATETLYNAILDARRIGGDVVVCDTLDRLGAGTGQQRYRYAAAAIRGQPPGRPSIDDDWALRRILKFPPDRHRDAVGLMAKDMAARAGPGGPKVKSIERRLHRKLENQKDEIVLSLAPTP